MTNHPLLTVVTAILYAGRMTRRVPETPRERREAIAECMDDAIAILAATVPPEAEAAEPDPPPPSPGIIGRKVEVKAARRRG